MVIPVDVCVQVVPTVPVQDVATVVVKVVSDFNVIAEADLIFNVEPDFMVVIPDTVVKDMLSFALILKSASVVILY